MEPPTQKLDFTGDDSLNQEQTLQNVVGPSQEFADSSHLFSLKMTRGRFLMYTFATVLSLTGIGGIIEMIKTGHTSVNGKSNPVYTGVLANVGDVTITSPHSGQVLAYDAQAQSWVNGTLALNALGDVNLASVQDFQLLAYHSTSGTWMNTSPSATQLGALPSNYDLSTIAAVNPTVSSVSLNNHKLTNLSNGVLATDGAAFGQIPTTLPPTGAAGGDLSGTYPNPLVTTTHLSSALPITQGGTGSTMQNFVDLTTNQTINGVKTFTDSPIVPTPTTATQAANKEYVDNNSGGGGLSVLNFGTIQGFDPGNTTQGNIYPTVTLTSSPQTISSGFTNPTNPRCVVVNDQELTQQGVFTINGTDALGNAISDSVDLSQNYYNNGGGFAGYWTGRCFATITSIDCPASDGNSFDFSTGPIIGLTTISANPIVGVPVFGGSCPISFEGLQGGWGFNTNSNATDVSYNSISLGVNTFTATTFVWIGFN